MKLARKMLLGVCAAFVPATGLVFATEIERTEWTSVPGATHYVGTLEEDGVTYSISTTSTWILTGKGSVKKIDAWTPRGPLQRGVETNSVPLSGSAPEPSLTSPPPPAPQLEQPVVEQEEPAPAEQAPAEEPAPEESGTEDVQEAPDTTTFTTWSRAGVSIGMGKQWLASKVGISEFSGSANIGGTILSGQYGSPASALWYEGEISAHNFTTETAKTDAASSTTKEERNTQTRFRGMIFYNFFQQVSSPSAPMTGLSAGAGLQYLSHPVLVIDNAQTGAAVMQTKSATALNLGVRHGFLMSFRNLIVTGLNLAPVNLSGDLKTMSTNVSAEWLHLITPRVFTNLGVTTGRETITHADKCPSVTNCRDEGASGSDLLQIRMGLAVGL
jgi:hypothetical protein